MKRIYRSRKNRVLAGICGGISEMLDVDPTLIRLGVVLAAVITAVVPFLITYLVGWIIIPDEDELENY